MSIWNSLPHIGFDTWEEDPVPFQGGQVRSYVDGWSNHYPTTDDTAELPAMIDTASIAPWCVPGHEDSDGRNDDGERCVGPWLRLSVDSPDTHIPIRTPEEIAERIAAWAGGETPPTDIEVGAWQHVSVVLDEPAVRSLVESLTEWLDHPKLHPTEAPT